MVMNLGHYASALPESAPASGLPGGITPRMKSSLILSSGLANSLPGQDARISPMPGYRGYLLIRIADLGHRSPAAYWVGVVLVAVLFGIGHFYKGPSGMIDSGVAGLILGADYMLAGRNLWASILGHGFIETLAVLVAFMGWDS